MDEGMDRQEEERGPRLPPGTPTRRLVRLTRRLTASPERVYRAWADPEELVRWFPLRVEGSLAVGTRSILIWDQERTWWDVVAAEPGRRFVFRWPWDPQERLVTTVTVTVSPIGMGSELTVEDGPFPIDEPGGLEAWAEALEGWAEAVTMLRAYLDFSVDVRRSGR
jgi:uncharacterized protein YndB with AHSA1/START domain